MLKTISAALLAVSVLAAPAFAATGKSMHATTHSPVIKSTQIKAASVNAKVRIAAHHGKYHHARYVRHHNHYKIAVHRTHPKSGFKPVSHAATSHTATKRG